MGASKTCLLIDDDRDDQEIFLIALRNCGLPVECQTATTGTGGLDRLDSDPQNKPDCIFLDLNMPGMSGRQCLSEIRKRSYLNEVPVVIYTTSSNPAEIREMKALGATEYITKPPSVKILSNLLSDFFSKYF